MKNEEIQDYGGKLSLVMQSVGVRAWMWIICLSTLLHYLLKRAKEGKGVELGDNATNSGF